MFAFKIAGDAVKILMNRILREGLMDAWEVRGVELVNFTRFEIAGLLENERSEDKQSRRYCAWPALRPYVLSLVKDGGKPRKLKIVFALPPDQTPGVHPNGAAFFLNMLYENDAIMFTTASAEKTFSMDRAVALAWDEYVRAFTMTWPKVELSDGEEAEEEIEDEDEDYEEDEK